MSLPAQNEVRLLLCDEVRLEQGNKLAILGFFPGSGVALPRSADDQPDAVQALTFVFMIEGGEGIYEAGMKIFGPDETVIFDQNMGSMQKMPGAVAVLICRVSPFKSTKWGEQYAILRLNEQDYRNLFTVQPNAVS
ncbi:hypothetical protein MMSR116_31550 [Methylobacterium mesophilicum SR1.6/6]|uniref:Uncharacterized protein n=1 Tax=Methylobacterium mesophilicum SR1.6/6 TaxID=908290 RepID=A0A6B9G1L8_9HYPH|nr:hypothetical protein [Methylobacterium mesophilicum]QGY05924.1 hypothetical protein MMSR116_31550 [Methylobacterium mesophilicum SR1.6/6]